VAIIKRVVIQPANVQIRLRLPALINEILGEAISTHNLSLIATIETQFHHVQQAAPCASSSAILTSPPMPAA
jgi:hypothetical protein